MFVTYLFHSYLLGPHNVKCLYAFETGIADTEPSFLGHRQAPVQ